jgi:hypothetical protein
MAPSEQLKLNRVNRPVGHACRKRLQNNFENCDNSETKSVDRSILSVLSFNDNTRRVLRNGAERFTKTLNSMRTTFGTITQVDML